MGVGGQCLILTALPPAHRPSTYCTGGWLGLGDGLFGYGKSPPNDVQALECPIHEVTLYQLHYPCCFMMAMMCW